MQFRVCNHGEPLANPLMAREKEYLYREKGRWEGWNKQRVHGVSLAESLPVKKRSLSPSFWALPSSQGVRATPAGLQTLFHEVSVCLFVYEIVHT